MKLVCAQAELNSALQLVSRAVATRPTHPVLANVLLTADAGTDRLSLTGFDLNLGIQTSFSADVKTSGAITLPAKLLGEIVSRLSVDSPVNLTIDDSSDEFNLISKSGNYKMRGMPADEFPELPLVETGSSVKVNITSFVQALKATLFASSSDEAKQLLTGVNLSFSGANMKAAATDGHRLAVLNLLNALEGDFDEDLDNNQDFSVTLPSRSLREVERLMNSWKGNEPVSLFYDRGQVVFLASDEIITSRTLEGVYPKYEQLLPDSFSHCIKLNRKPFIESLERVAVLADQHNNVVKISTESASEKLKISADVQDVGSGSESLSISYEGPDIQIAFNVKYVLDGIKAIDSDYIYLRCNAPTTPAVFSPTEEDKGFTYLVMPVQIRV